MTGDLERELLNSLRAGVPAAELSWQPIPGTELRGYFIDEAVARRPLPAEVVEQVMEAPPFWSLLWPAGARLCRALDRVPIENRSCIDLGCGSGILAAAAAARGARVLAADTDPLALRATTLNAAGNGVSVKVTEWWGGEATDTLLLADFLYDDSNLGLLESFQAAAEEIVVVDSRLKTLEKEGFKHLGEAPGRAVPDLDPHREFGCLNCWYFGPRAELWQAAFLRDDRP